MLVVLAVVAVAAGVLLPRLADVGAARVEREANRLAEAVTVARERAILGGMPATLVVDTVNGRWTAGDLEAATLPPGVRFRAGAGQSVVRIDLDPAGDPFAARFDLVDDGGHGAAVIVPPAGRAATVVAR